MNDILIAIFRASLLKSLRFIILSMGHGGVGCWGNNWRAYCGNRGGNGNSGFGGDSGSWGSDSGNWSGGVGLIRCVSNISLVRGTDQFVEYINGVKIAN